jgi:hypothetical protein
MVGLTYDGSMKTIALFQGLQVAELHKLLEAVFFLPSGSSPVGFLAERGLVIALSLACQVPQMVPTSGCVLLVTGPDNTSENLPVPSHKHIHDNTVSSITDIQSYKSKCNLEVNSVHHFNGGGSTVNRFNFMRG